MKKCIFWMMTALWIQGTQAAMVTLDANKLTVTDAKVGNGTSISTGNAAINWDTTELSSPQTAYILTFSFDAIPDGDKDSFLRLNSTVGWGLATQSTTTMKLASSQFSVVGEALTINTTNTFALTFATVDEIGYAIISDLNTGAYVELTSTENTGVTTANFNIGSNAYARIWTNSGANQVTMGQIASLSGLSITQVRAVARSGTYATVMYWKGGSGNWSDASWAETESGSGTMLYTNEVPTFFAEDVTATIHVDADGVNPTSLTVSAGTYTFTGNSPLDATDTLAVSGGAATFTMDIEVGTAEVSNSGALIGNTVTVQTLLNMDSGSLSIDTLNGSGEVNITGGSVELGDISGISGSLIITDTLLKGTTVLDNANLLIGDSTVAATGSVLIESTTLTGAITVVSGGALQFAGEMSLGEEMQGEEDMNYSENGVTISTAAVNGYRSMSTVYTVAQGNLNSISSSAVWRNKEGELCQYDAGRVFYVGTIDTTVYWLNEDATINDLILLPTVETLMLNGAILSLSAPYESTALLQTTSTGGTVLLNDTNTELSSSHIAEATKSLAIDGQGLYHTDGSAMLHASGQVALADSWVGTVVTGDVSGEVLDVTALANANSRLEMGAVSAQRMVAGSAAAIKISSLTLTEGISTISADVVTLGVLTLGTSEAPAYLNVSGVVTLGGEVNWGNAASCITAEELGAGTTALHFHMSREQLCTIEAETPLLQLDRAATDVALTLNGAASVTGDKYEYSISWDAAGKTVRIVPDFNVNFYEAAATSANGAAGAALVTAAMQALNPQATNPAGNLADVMDSLDALIRRDSAAADGLMAAIAGASAAAMGHAFCADIHRQLRAIRNRTTTMGVNPCVVNPDMPYFNAWIHAEMDYTELGAEGTKSGYQLTHGGGTVGFDVDATPQITFGLAFTAMWGDFTAKSAEDADGDLDIYYLTLFGRYVSKRWTHTFVAAAGRASSSLERNITHTYGQYTTRGDSNGVSLGMMYELGYVFALDEDSETCLQPVFNIAYIHARTDGYTEHGSDAALHFGRMEMNSVVLGMGVRMQTSAASDACNHAAIFEARALLNCYTGDRDCTGEVSLAAVPGTSARITSAEHGVVAAELGVGLTLPLADKSSAVFLDATALFSSEYSHVNATVGYRLNF